MSPTVVRTGTSASRRSFGAGSGTDGAGHESSFRHSDDRAETTRNAGSSVDVLEPHWQASIESATD
jgi:hypothetical protein